MLITCAKTLLKFLVLMVWETVVVLLFVFAIVASIVMYGCWLPMLTVRSWHRHYEYGIPFRRTWHEAYYLGSSYNPANTFASNAQGLLLEVAGNVWWSICSDWRAYRHCADRSIAV